MAFFAGIGSRQTPINIIKDMVHISKKLVSAGYTLRSGGADGADSAFELGADNAILTDDHERKQIFLPWKGFNKRVSQFDHPTHDAFEIAKKFHPAWNKLSSGGKALHARNVHQILGPDLDSPVEFVVCWTPDGQISGGTGQALRIAMKLEIPIHNLAIKPFVMP